MSLETRAGLLLEESCHLSGASRAALLLLYPEESEARLLQAEGVVAQRLPLASLAPLVQWAAIGTETCLRWRDLQALPQLQSMPPEGRAALESLGPERILPMRRKERLGGLLLLGPASPADAQEGVTTGRIARLLEIAAWGIEDARLYGLVEAKAQTLEAQDLAQRQRLLAISGDLKDRLAAQRAAAGMLRDGRYGDDQARERLVEVVAKGVTAMEALVSDLPRDVSAGHDASHDRRTAPKVPALAVEVRASAAAQQRGIEVPGVKVLVMEGAPDAAEVLALALERFWPACVVLTAPTGAEALRLATRARPDLVLLADSVPDMGGAKACQEIRAVSRAPIIMLGYREDDEAVLSGLAAGADDYVAVPFSYPQLLARAQALLRRGRPETVGGPTGMYASGRLWVSFSTREARIGSHSVMLTGTECRVLHRLIEAQGEVVPLGQVLTAVWGPSYAGASYLLKVHIQHLRGKIEEDPSHPRIILTQRGQGYRFVPPLW